MKDTAPDETAAMLADVGPVVNRVIRIDDIEPHPQNFNEHPEAQVRDLMASDVRFNQVRSIVVQQGAPDHYLMVAGHGYTLARKERGRVYVKADIIPADWTAEQVVGYLIADNLLTRKGLVNEDVLATLLRDQQNAGVDLASLGVDEAFLTDIFAKVEQVPSLDDLADTYGDEPGDDDFWPVIRLKVSPETKERFESLLEQAGGTSDDVKLARIVAAVDTTILEDEL